MTSSPLVQPFPSPPHGVQQAIDRLTASVNWTEAQRAEVDPRSLDRPWDPGSCDPAVRRQVWPWLDDVAGWVNHEYGWQTARVIPACWPRHPHLVHELAVLACLRVAAADATSPQPLEEWHRYVLPGFCERMTERIGPVACPPGRHTDWPARSRYLEFTSAEAIDTRNQLFEADAPLDGHTDAAPLAAAGCQRPALRAVPAPDSTEGDHQ